MPYKIALKPRGETSRLFDWSIAPLIIIASLVVGAIPILMNGVSPIAAYYEMLVKPLTSMYGISETLVKLIPLLLAGLAVYLPLRAGLWNVGAEGQLYIGAIATTWIGLRVNAPELVLLSLMIIGGALAGAFWGFIPGYLRAKWGVNEILVSLLMVFIAEALNTYAILHPLARTGGFPASPILPTQLPTIGGTRLHYGILFAVVSAIGIYLLLERTTLGYEITVMGSNPTAAQESGISKYHTYILAMTIGGLLGGLAGVGEVAGLLGRLRGSVSPGYGFTAIPIALLGRDGVPQVVLASCFFALLFTGGRGLQSAFGLPFALTEIIQALVILFLIVGMTLRRYKINLVRTSNEVSN